MIDYLSVEICWQKEKPTVAGVYLWKKEGTHNSLSRICEIFAFNEGNQIWFSGESDLYLLDDVAERLWLSIPE